MGLVQILTSLSFNFMPAPIHTQPAQTLTRELLRHKGALITIHKPGLTRISSFHVYGDQRNVFCASFPPPTSIKQNQTKKPTHLLKTDISVKLTSYNQDSHNSRHSGAKCRYVNSHIWMTNMPLNLIKTKTSTIPS